MVLKDCIVLTKPLISCLSGVCAVAGFLLADADASAGTLTMAFSGTALAVAAASILNMYLERDTDARMLRTRKRPLADGRLHPWGALALGAGAAALGLFLMAQLSWMAFWLTAASLFLYDFVYTPLKRRTPYAFVVGVLPGAAPPLMGWSAATGTITGGGLWLFVLFLIWQIPHIIAIYIYLGPDYRRAGIPVFPYRVGMGQALWISLAFSVALLAASVVFAWNYIPHPAATTLAVVAGAWLLWQNARCLRAIDLESWARSFMRSTLVYIALVVTSLTLFLGRNFL